MCVCSKNCWYRNSSTVPVHLYKVKPAIGGYTGERAVWYILKKPIHLKEVIRSLGDKYAKISYDKSPGLDWYHKLLLGGY